MVSCRLGSELRDLAAQLLGQLGKLYSAGLHVFPPWRISETARLTPAMSAQFSLTPPPSARRARCIPHASGSLRNVARHVFGDRCLLLNGRGDARDNHAHIFDHRCDLPNVGDCHSCRTLNARDLLLDVFSSFGGLLGKFFDLVGYNREALARRSRSRCFNGRVQCKQIGLRRDVGDGLGNMTDLLRSLNTPAR